MFYLKKNLKADVNADTNAETSQMAFSKQLLLAQQN